MCIQLVVVDLALWFCDVGLTVETTCMLNVVKVCCAVSLNTGYTPWKNPKCNRIAAI